MKCPECGKKFSRVLESIDIGNDDQKFRIKNNVKTSVCQDCLQDTFFDVMEKIMGNESPVK